MPAQDFLAGSSTPAFPPTLLRGRAPSSSVTPSPWSPHSGLRPDLPFERFSSICHEGPVSSRDWPADQHHPLQALGTHRLGLVVMNFGTLKRLVELNQAIIPTLWLRAMSPWKGQRPIQSPVNSGGKRALSGARSRSGEGLGWGIQSLAQSFLRGNGTPVSTWQIPVRWLLKIQRRNWAERRGK